MATLIIEGMFFVSQGIKNGLPGYLNMIDRGCILEYVNIYSNEGGPMDNTMDTCQDECVHTEVVDKVNAKMEAEETLFQLADFFKALGDSTRVRILHALSFSELCVCDLASILNMSSSAVSHQLRVLRGQKIVKYRKEGKNAIYSLDDSHVATLLEQGLRHVNE